jgi:hypothetical protein
MSDLAFFLDDPLLFAARHALIGPYRIENV